MSGGVATFRPFSHMHYYPEDLFVSMQISKSVGPDIVQTLLSQLPSSNTDTVDDVCSFVLISNSNLIVPVFLQSKIHFF